MNMKIDSVPLKHRKVAHAWVDGAEVEFKDGGDWFECIEPRWFEYFEYRIKPKPKVKKWRWVAFNNQKHDFYITSQNYTEAEAAVFGCRQKIDISMIEVDAE